MYQKLDECLSCNFAMYQKLNECLSCKLSKFDDLDDCLSCKLSKFEVYHVNSNVCPVINSWKKKKTSYVKQQVLRGNT